MPITANVVRSKTVIDRTLCDKVCQWLAAGWWLSPGTLVSSTYKTGCHDITKILLKMALNTITLTHYNLLLLIYTKAQKHAYLIKNHIFHLLPLLSQAWELLHINIGEQVKDLNFNQNCFLVWKSDIIREVASVEGEI